MPDAEQLTDPVAHHAEGPVWFPDPGELRWVDMLAGDVLSLGADGAISRRDVGTIAAVVRPRVRGGFIVGVERGFALDDGDGSPLRTLPELWQDSGVRMNEGGCDPDGRFYCGSMAYDQATGAGSLYRLSPDGSVNVVLDSVSVSNGLEWSPDGTRAYYNDTPTQRVDVFDYSTEQGLHNRRPLVTISSDDGSPDGLTVDADGGIWVALFGGSAVHRYSPDGILDHVVSVPASQVTACTLGGASMDTLFITTSADGLPEGKEPLAGSVFQLPHAAPGRPVRPFQG